MSDNMEKEELQEELQEEMIEDVQETDTEEAQDGDQADEDNVLCEHEPAVAFELHDREPPT